MTRQLRILTGYHAGARLDLPPGRHIIGADEQADVHISDWHGDPVTIAFAEDGTVTLASATNVGATPVVMGDFVPARRGDIVLCVGPGDAPWPAEVKLLEAMFAPVPAPAAAPAAAAPATSAPATPAPSTATAPASSRTRPRRRWLRIGVCAVVATTAIGAAMAMSMTRMPKASASVTTPAPAPAPELTPMQRRLATVEHALRTSGQRDLKASVTDDNIVVSGMVPTAADAATLRRALAQVDNGHVAVRLSVAASIADDLRASLSDPGAEVSYSGDGVFRVGGTVRDPARARALIERIRGDYGTAVRRIDVDLAGQAADNTPRNVHAALHVEGLRYYQLPDGTKNFPDEMRTPETLAESAR
ncbi:MULTISPECIES: HrpD5 family protein [unclassified Cupriavidus]|uniref:HrpD5 family protein n=1 Tax=unclassified Cupriavidus TaxID=2640874 RepID=UPI00313DA767